MGWFEDIDEPEVVASPPVEVLPKPTVWKPSENRLKQVREDEIKNIEDELLKENLRIVQDVAKFRDVDPSVEGIPDEWLRSGMSPQEAMKTLRVARSGWMATKDAPVALGLAKSIVIGIIKARSTEKAAPRSHNIGMLTMNVNLPNFPIMEDD